jgi:hypothetical protein
VLFDRLNRAELLYTTPRQRVAIRMLWRRVWEPEQMVPAEAPQAIANCAIASA